MSLKPSDYYCLPLCQEHHHILHQTGEKSFWKTVRIDPDLEMVNCLQEFIGTLSVYNCTHKERREYLVDYLRSEQDESP